jgi:hypothetical protein
MWLYKAKLGKNRLFRLNLTIFDYTWLYYINLGYTKLYLAKLSYIRLNLTKLSYFG